MFALLTEIPGLGSRRFKLLPISYEINANHSRIPKSGSGKSHRLQQVLNHETWVRGIEGIFFLHLDLRTPFREFPEDEAVIRLLEDITGPAKDAPKLKGWHLLGSEDTNMGTVHRIFVTLQQGVSENNFAKDVNAPGKSVLSADHEIPIELGLFALAQAEVQKQGKSALRITVDSDRFHYSLLMVQGQPWHLLRLEKSANETWKAEQFAWQHESLARKTGLERDRIPVVNLSDSPGKSQKGNTDALHCGLWLATLEGGLKEHDGVEDRVRVINDSWRFGRTLFMKSGLALLLGFSLVFLLGLFQIKQKRELKILRTRAQTYLVQVKALDGLRGQEDSLRQSLLGRQDLWPSPSHAGQSIGYLAAALPPGSKLETISFKPKTSGEAVVELQGLVADWNAMGKLQKSWSALSIVDSLRFRDQRQSSEGRNVAFSASLMMKQWQP